MGLAVELTGLGKFVGERIALQGQGAMRFPVLAEAAAQGMPGFGEEARRGQVGNRAARADARRQAQRVTAEEQLPGAAILHRNLRETVDRAPVPGVLIAPDRWI